MASSSPLCLRRVALVPGMCSMLGHSGDPKEALPLGCRASEMGVQVGGTLMGHHKCGCLNPQAGMPGGTLCPYLPAFS